MENRDFEFRGDHLFGEIGGLPIDVLNDVTLLRRVLEQAIPKGRATLRQIVHEKFEPHGVTMIAVLSESHASFHTFPETGDMFVDVFTCGHCDPEAIFKDMVAQLNPGYSTFKQIVREGPGAAQAKAMLATTGA